MNAAATQIAPEKSLTEKVEPVLEKAFEQFLEPNQEIFILMYKTRHEVKKLQFQAENLAAAVSLGQEYCNKRTLRFITVNPFLTNIKKEMNRKESEI